MKTGSVISVLLFVYVFDSISGCSISDLPNNLIPNSGSNSGFGSGSGDTYYGYGELIKVTCQTNYLLVDNVFQTDMEIRCSRRWEIPKYECVVGCTQPSHKAFQINSGNLIPRISKVNTAFDINCKVGKMYHVGVPSYFITKSYTACEEDGNWRFDHVDCWTDQIVDFTSSRQTLLSNQKTVFACTSTVKTHKVKIKIGETVFQTELAAWGVIQLNSKYNQETAFCEVTDISGNVVKRKGTELNVLFSPELLRDAKNFGLVGGETGYITLEFDANPTLPPSSVKITKNGIKLQNYYLSVEEFTHKVVVHFIQVRDTDFGDYTMTVTSFSPFANVFTTNFTISPTNQTPAPLNGTQGAFIALGAVAVVLVIAVIVYMTRPMFEEKLEIGDKQGTNAVSYQAGGQDHHSYEDIVDQTGNGMNDVGGYVNVNIAGRSTQSSKSDKANNEDENPYCS